MTVRGAGMTLVLQDVWQPERRETAKIIRTRGRHVHHGRDAIPRTTWCARAERPTPLAFGLSLLKGVFVCGRAGAPRPGAKCKGRVAMGAQINSCWGMSEIAAVTMTGPDDPEDRVFETDGSALPGVELRVLALDVERCTRAGRGGPAPYRVRACRPFGGYLKRPDLERVGCRRLVRHRRPRPRRLTAAISESAGAPRTWSSAAARTSRWWRSKTCSTGIPAVAQGGRGRMPDERLGERLRVRGPPGRAAHRVRRCRLARSRRARRSSTYPSAWSWWRDAATPTGKIQKFGCGSRRRSSRSSAPQSPHQAWLPARRAAVLARTSTQRMNRGSLNEPEFIL